MRTTGQTIIATAQSAHYVLTQIAGARYGALHASVYASLDLIHEIVQASAATADEYTALLDEKKRELYSKLTECLTDAEAWLAASWILTEHAFMLCDLADEDSVARYADTSRDYLAQVAQSLSAKEVYQIRSLRGRDLDKALAAVLGEDYKTLVDYTWVDEEIARADATIY